MIHQYPKQSKYRKTTHKHIIKTDFKKANTNLLRGMFGIKTLTGGNLLFKQIETARRKIVKGQRDKMKTWIRVMFNIPITAKPKEMRMGKGKGNVSHWIANVKAGQIIFEIYGKISYSIVYKNLLNAIQTLPIPCIIVKQSNKALR